MIFIYFFIFSISFASEQENREYLIKSGDTLETIAKDLLGDSKLWPLLLNQNPGIINDGELKLGKKITVDFDEDFLKRVQLLPINILSPKIREISQSHPAKFLAPRLVEKVINNPILISELSASEIGYVLSTTDDSILISNNSRIEAMNLPVSEAGIYKIMRLVKNISHPDNMKRDIIVETIGTAKVLENTDLSALVVIDNIKEIIVGDILVERKEQPVLPSIEFKTPDFDVNLEVVEVFNSGLITFGGSAMIISGGRKNGLVSGHMLTVIDSFAEKTDDSLVNFENEMNQSCQYRGELFAKKPNSEFDCFQYSDLVSLENNDRTLGSYDRTNKIVIVKALDYFSYALSMGPLSFLAVSGDNVIVEKFQ